MDFLNDAPSVCDLFQLHQKLDERDAKMTISGLDAQGAAEFDPCHHACHGARARAVALRAFPMCGTGRLIFIMSPPLLLLPQACAREKPVRDPISVAPAVLEWLRAVFASGAGAPPPLPSGRGLVPLNQSGEGGEGGGEGAGRRRRWGEGQRQ